MPLTRKSLASLFLLVAAPFLLLALCAPAVGEQVDRGEATTGAFGLLLALYSFLLRPLANRLEAIVFGIGQRPWLGGRLTRWQRLVLPYSTSLVLTLGVSWGLGGSVYLLSAAPGGSVLNVAAVFFCGIGGALVGFALARLGAGLLIIRCSGLWAAPRSAWLAGGTAVAIGSLAFAANSIVRTMQLSPVL